MTAAPPGVRRKVLAQLVGVEPEMIENDVTGSTAATATFCWPRGVDEREVDFSRVTPYCVTEVRLGDL